MLGALRRRLEPELGPVAEAFVPWGEPDRGEGPRECGDGSLTLLAAGVVVSLLSAALGKDLKRHRQR